MSKLRAALLLSAGLAAGCAAFSATSEDAAPVNADAAPPASTSDAGDLDADPGTDTDRGVDETPVDEDAGVVSEVVSVDASVPGCPEPGLVARWRIDELTGDAVADCSGNGLHGRVTAGTRTTNGADGGALQFTGQGWIGFGNPALLRLQGAITVSMWIRPDKPTTSTAYLLGKTSNPGTNGWRFAITGNQLAFATPSSSNYFNAVGGNVPTGTWMHVAALFDPSNRSAVFINGAKVGGRSSDVPAALVASNAEARAAARTDGQYGFKGAVSDVRVYNRALSGAEITALAKR